MNTTKQYKTNVEHVTHIMEFSKHGALMQAFIIDALTKYSAQVVKNEDKLKEAMKDSWVSPEAWVGCAKELNAHMNQKY